MEGSLDRFEGELIGVPLDVGVTERHSEREERIDLSIRPSAFLGPFERYQ